MGSSSRTRDDCPPVSRKAAKLCAISSRLGTLVDRLVCVEGDHLPSVTRLAVQHQRAVVRQWLPSVRTQRCTVAFQSVSCSDSTPRGEAMSSAGTGSVSVPHPVIGSRWATCAAWVIVSMRRGALSLPVELPVMVDDYLCSRVMLDEHVYSVSLQHSMFR